VEVFLERDIVADVCGKNAFPVGGKEGNEKKDIHVTANIFNIDVLPLVFFNQFARKYMSLEVRENKCFS